MTTNLAKKIITLLASKDPRVISLKYLGVWTSDKIIKSPYKDVDIPNRTIPEHVWENLGRWPDKLSLVCGVTNHSYTYHQLYKYSRNLAAKLRNKLKLQDNDVVCVMMPNSPDYAVAILGILQAGGEVTTVNPIYTAHEVERQLHLSKPKLIITIPEMISTLKEAQTLAGLEIPIMVVKTANESRPQGTISFEEFALDNTVDHSVLNKISKKPTDTAFLPYSSGTTGLPKGVELSNRNLVSNFLQLDAEGVKNYCDTTSHSQDAALGVLPFFHIYGLTGVLLHKLSVGLKIVSLPKFTPTSFCSAMKEHRINLLMATPPLGVLLHKLSVGLKIVSLPKFTPTSFCSAMKEHRINLLMATPPLVLFAGSHKDVTKEHLAHLKVMTSGAAPLPLNDVRRVIEKCAPGMNFLQLYGLTETSPIVTGMNPGSTNYSSSGFAVPNTELRIVDGDMNNLGPNEVGELLIRGPQVMKGYRNNPEATKAAITEDGWFKSGDLAKVDENGAVTIVDRLKELIKVKGFQVPPAELENVLKEHPSILDAAVIGIPDARQGEAPKAFIVVKDGHNLNEVDVIKFVDERVAAYKRVKEVIFLDVLPKNPSGKILRKVLRESYS